MLGLEFRMYKEWDLLKVQRQHLKEIKIWGTILLMLRSMPPNLEGQADSAFCEQLQTKSKHWIVQ